MNKSLDQPTRSDREDGEPPRCGYGDGPCISPDRCRDAGFCVPAHYSRVEELADAG